METQIEPLICPIFPPFEGEFDFDELECIPSGPETNIVDDSELCVKRPKSVIEMIGNNSRITFLTETSLPLVVLHVKTVGRYFAFLLVLKDNEGNERFFDVSNNRSRIIVDQNTAQLPVLLQDRGWQRICFDLRDLMKHAFGSQYHSCLELTVCGSSRLSKVYFQDRDYSDVELPHFLKVANFD